MTFPFFSEVLGIHFGLTNYKAVDLEHRLLIVVASLVVEHMLYGIKASGVDAHRLQSTGSIVEGHRLNCPGPCGVFSDQGWNPCPLHCKVDS